MDKIYTTDLKYLIPILGIIIGWLLNSFSNFFKGVTEKQRIIGKALAQLHFLYFEQHKLLLHFDFLKDNYEIGPAYEEMRIRAMQKYVLNNDNLKISLEIIKELSGVYPLIAINLKGMVENYAFTQQINFTATSLHQPLYLKMISLFETGIELEHKFLRKTILRLAFGYNTITWIKMLWKYNRLEKNLGLIERPNFLQEIEREIGLVASNEKQKNKP